MYMEDQKSLGWGKKGDKRRSPFERGRPSLSFIHFLPLFLPSKRQNLLTIQGSYSIMTRVVEKKAINCPNGPFLHLSIHLTLSNHP